jgi:hypothetical protein
LAQELENEKKEKVRLQTFQNQLLIAQEEKVQLRNEVILSFFHQIIYVLFSRLIILNYIIMN